LEDHANPRFGTFAEYPAHCFHPQPPSENVDGQSHSADDGAMQVIFASCKCRELNACQLGKDDPRLWRRQCRCQLSR
jgi:hypothetical protein